MSSARGSLRLLEKCINMRQLKQAHAQIVLGGLGENRFAISRILAFCSDPNSGCVAHAQVLFRQTKQPTICICNTMIKTLLLKGEYTRLADIYRQILHDGLLPDNYTFPYMLKGCAHLRDSQIGEQVHGHALQLGFDFDVFVGNTLILMYSACGKMEDAHQMFDLTPQRNAASWTVLISAYSKLGEVGAARELFDQSQVKDRGVWGCMISGYCLCPTGGPRSRHWIHRYLKRVGFTLGIRLSTALIDMYLKSGDWALAIKLFANMPQRDVISWNVMIIGLATHGDGRGALELFAQMQREGFSPDETTFLAVLSACSHSGLVSEGLRQFKSMKAVHGIEPRGEHYGCVVDFLSRAGLFNEAQGIIAMMPTSSSPSEKAVAWRALLSACWRHGEEQLAELAARCLLQLEDHSGAYVLLSNVYRRSGRHGVAEGVKKLMWGRGVAKPPGCSSVEIGGSVHEFVAGERVHRQMSQVYEVLHAMSHHMDDNGAT
ncbi:unnamed protein product [Spirodela intermedia]|uniref:Uncharacterized protein n=1 Tax=Spirodela intermedia TaxID=51605 RepID=A0A7I8IHU4_SPIIN|nr:unnamed protein product [Spirodela intermedia]CAA6657422.1 unnamed protein product [Spirodela intermedia]